MKTKSCLVQEVSVLCHPVETRAFTLGVLALVLPAFAGPAPPSGVAGDGLRDADSAAGGIPYVQATVVDQIAPRFRDTDDGPAMRRNHPPLDEIAPVPMPDAGDWPGLTPPRASIFHDAVTGEQEASAAGYPASPVSVEAALDGPPILGIATILTCTVSSAVDLPAVDVWVTVPDGVACDAPLQPRRLALDGGVPVSFSDEVVAEEVGDRTLECYARSKPENGNWVGDVARLYLSVGETNGSWSTIAPGIGVPRLAQPAIPTEPPADTRAPIRMERGRTPEPCEHDPTLLPPILRPRFEDSGEFPLDARADLTVTGRYYYIDRDEVVVPRKWVTVWVYDDDFWTEDDFLGDALTDEDGYFTAGPFDADEIGGDGQDIYVGFLAASSAAEVRDSSDDTYDGWTGVWENVSSGTLDIGSWQPPGGDKRAWWIYDTLLLGWDYLANSGPGYVMELSTVRWPRESWPHYHQGGQIHLPDDNAADSPDVIIHEYGHNVMYVVYDGYTSNCSYPQSMGSASNVNFAWTEGWANFMPLAVFNDGWLTYVNHSNWNLESPPGGWDDGDDVDGRVAGALFDIFDPANDEPADDGITEIWDTFSSQDDSAFSEYWSAWKSDGHETHNAVQAIYENTIDYDTAPSLSGLPDRTLEKGEPADNSIDLWSYASDPESSDSELAFEITDVTDSNCGVSIDSNRYVDIDPTFCWLGSCDVTVSASDNIKSDTDVFRITVVPVGEGGIPTVSERGLVVMTLLTLTAGTMVLRRRGAVRG